MNKKLIPYIVILILCIIGAIIFIDFPHTEVLDNTIQMQHKFFITIGDYGNTTFMYDPYTQIVYIQVYGAYSKSITEYYTIINNEPVIARYKINWTEDDLQ